MVVYNFRTLKPVPSSNELLDIVLSRTQRKTATQVHRRFNIARIRQFYMTKIKYTQTTFHERISAIVDEFPRLDTIHPFYGDLINVLYDRDHYKLALGQLNMARTLIDNVAKDYLRLLKFGDSLYRCKLLKRAALGRMGTITKKLKSSLGYLEQVRQHLSRLPSIDPSTRTLLLTGYPNVGKSSFINKVTRADVDVQPYAFTTKSLFVGHMDYKYLRWQVIDTPGILDHPLEDRNTIEMQSITALAHLNCAIVFILDVSGTSEYSIAQQVSLFKNIRPLFANKPLVLVANKVDIQTLDALDDEDRALIASVTEDGKIPLIPMSNVAGDGINDVKTQACDLLLEHRISAKLRTNKVDSIRHRINVARPVARDNKERPVHIPASVLAARAAGAASDAMPVEKRRLMREIEAEGAGAGVFNFDMRMHWDLDDATWTQDGIPEIWNGRNVADFFDADIEARLNALEAEEAIRCDDDDESDGESDLDPEQKALAQAIDKKKRLLKIKARDVRTMNQPQLPRTKQPAKSIDEFAQHLETMGLPSDKVRERTRGRKRARHPPADAMDVEEDMVDDDAAPASVKIARVRSRSRARSMTPGKETAFKDEKAQARARRLAKIDQRPSNRMARAGEADRAIRDAKPKWLFSGKRGIGKTDRR